MGFELTDKIIGYHYTNFENYQSMQTKGIDGFSTQEFDEFVGLIPSRRFIGFGNGNLPDKAHKDVIEALLEPEPKSWMENPEFPQFWYYLMHDICRKEKIVLLSFELTQKDEAFVVDRAHVERELYRESKGLGKSTKETRSEAFRKYWESRVNVFKYDGTYDAPQLAIWSGIEFDRLKIEWIKSSKDVWNRVKKNNW